MKLVVDVKVSNLERAVKFYTEVLGLTCRVQAEDWAGLQVGDPGRAGAEIHLYKDGGVNEGVEFYVQDIEEKVATLSQHGVEFISGMHKPSALSVDKSGITGFPWGRMAYFKDSEGNELAFVEDYYLQKN